MMSLLALVIAVASLAAAQQTSFAPGTGVRSLWIPFQTVSGTPLASIAGRDEKSNVTVYVVSCPTATPQCALAPNLTLTEGPNTARYIIRNSAGAATLGCDFTGTTQAVCNQAVEGNNDVRRSSTTVGPSQIVYQAVDVTQTINNTRTEPVTVTVTPSSTTSSTSSSTAGAQTAGGAWAMGGAVGAGLVALAAL